MRPTGDMTKRELATALAAHTPKTPEQVRSAVSWYVANMTTAQLREQVEYVRGERSQDQLTHKYDH